MARFARQGGVQNVHDTVSEKSDPSQVGGGGGSEMSWDMFDSPPLTPRHSGARAPFHAQSVCTNQPYEVIAKINSRAANWRGRNISCCGQWCHNGR